MSAGTVFSAATFIRQTIFEQPDKPALVSDEAVLSFADLHKRFEESLTFLANRGIRPGESVALEGDFSVESIALLLALLQNNNIITPVLQSLPAAEKRFFYETSRAAHLITTDGGTTYSRLPQKSDHPLFESLQNDNVPGLVIYTSGTTGEPRAALHNAGRLLQRFYKKRKSFRTLGSLLFDHIGGMDVLFTTLTANGSLIILPSFDAHEVCRCIDRHKAELFPATATLLKMLVLSESYREHDLSSVKLITYGSEVMPEYLLARLKEIFPNATLKQTFGMTETGTLSTVSRDSDTLWMKFAGSEQQIRVKDNRLFIKSDRSMLGYLNAPNPIDDEGWLDTQDEVQVEGEWLKILGRQNDTINVGGQKVFPAEVESVIGLLDDVLDVTVKGEANPILGKMVVAHVNAVAGVDTEALKKRIRGHCKEKLAAYKVPQKIVFVDSDNYNYRMKKVRK